MQERGHVEGRVKEERGDLRVVVELDLPSSLCVDIPSISTCHHVANDLDLLSLRTDQVVQERLDARRHAAAQHNNRDIVLSGVLKECLEARVQRDILNQISNALIEGARHTVHHLAELIAKGGLAVQNGPVTRLALLCSKSNRVRHEVVAVSLCDRTVEVREEDELGVGLHGREGSVDGAHVGCLWDEIAVV